MTNAFDFSEPYSRAGVNLYGSGIATSAVEEYQRPQWKRLNLPGLPRNVVCTEVRILDLRNGWLQNSDMIGTSSATVDLRYPRHMLLTPKTTQTTLGGAMNNGCLFHAHVGPDQALIMGGGSTLGYSIFKETSATDPTPVRINAGIGTTNVVGFAPITGAGLSGSWQVAVQFDGNTATELWSNLTPSVTGAMHANTANCWAFVSSPINAATPGVTTFLIYAGTSMYTLTSSSAIGTAPTEVMTNMPGGGYPLGIDQLQKSLPVRLFLVVPNASRTTSMLAAGAPGEVISVNLEGTDPQPVPLGLSRVYWACLWNRTVVATDGVRAVAYDGESVRDLHILKGREQDTDYRWGCSGFAVNGGELYAMIVRTDLTVAANSVGISVLSVEKYNPELDSWVPVSGTMSAATSLLGNASGDAARATPYGRGDNLHNVGSSMPISRQSGHLHLNMRNSTKWNRMFIAPEDINPFYHYSRTSIDTLISQLWTASGVWTSNKFPIPGLQRWPSMVDPPQTPSTVIYEIDATELSIDAGGETATLKVEAARQTGITHSFTDSLAWTFKAGDPYSQQVRRFYNNTSAFTRCQLRMTLTQGAVTTQTLQTLPLTVRFMTFLDGNVIEPRTIFEKVKA